MYPALEKVISSHMRNDLVSDRKQILLNLHLTNYASISDLMKWAVRYGMRSRCLAGQPTHHAWPYLGVWLDSQLIMHDYISVSGWTANSSCMTRSWCLAGQPTHHAWPDLGVWLDSQLTMHDHISVSGWTANSPCMTISRCLAGQPTHHAWPYLENSIFLFLPSSSAASVSWRRLPFYHAATHFIAYIIKTWHLQRRAGWTSVNDTRSVAASSQCCSSSRRWSWSSGPRDRTDEGASLVTNQIPNQFQVIRWCSQYICDIVHPLSTSLGRNRLRAAASGQFDIPRTRTVFVDRAFSVAGTREWNTLRQDVTDITNREAFERAFKTYYFKLANDC